MKAASFTPRRLQIALIGIPMLLGLLYFVLVAANRYTSESIVAVRAAVVSNAGSPLSAMSGASLAAFADTLYLIDYVRSANVAEELDKKLQLRKHYEDGNHIDLFFRLWPSSSRETYLDYYRARVELEFDDTNGLLTIRPQAFTPEMANSVSRAILESCERFVNEFSNRIGREQMAFAEQELADSSGRLQRAKEKVTEFQATNRIVDPTAQQVAASSLTAQLQSQIATLEADLKAKLAYMQPDAPMVQALRDQVNATKAQLGEERARTTSLTSGDRLGALAVQYQELVLQAQFAQATYESANGAYQAARIEAAQKLKSLVVVAKPVVPESAKYPRRIYDLLTLLALCIIAYTVTRLIVAAIREHQD